MPTELTPTPTADLVPTGTADATRTAPPPATRTGTPDGELPFEIFLPFAQRPAPGAGQANRYAVPRRAP